MKITTREKAIKILNEWVEITKSSEDYNKDEGFLYTDIGTITYGNIEEAIKILEQEPCDNAINRQAVLEIFGYVMDYWKEHAIDVEPHEIEDALIEQYEFTAKKLSELPPVTPQEPKTKWIPVSERLPEEGQRVLVTQIFGERTVVYCTTFPFEKIKEKYITAWMPLPKSYKPD